MSEFEQARQRVQRSTQSFGAPQAPQTQHLQQSARQQADQGLDALLDQIDSVLETNAEEYVRSFVQKGGQ